MPQQTPIHLTWQTIQDAINNSPLAWYGYKPRSIRQLDDFMRSEQGNQAHDSELSNEQLFQVAQILIKKQSSPT